MTDNTTIHQVLTFGAVQYEDFLTALDLTFKNAKGEVIETAYDCTATLILHNDFIKSGTAFFHYGDELICSRRVEWTDKDKFVGQIKEKAKDIFQKKVSGE